VVGHKGAAHIEPGNTLQSFDAAMQAGVDSIEFDVMSEHRDGSGRLVVAHDAEELSRRPVLTLETALEHMSRREFGSIELILDLKTPTRALEVFARLSDAELIPRAMLSGASRSSLARIRAKAPELRLLWTVPLVRRSSSWTPSTMPAVAALTGYRALLPRRAREALLRGRFDAIMAHWRVVTPALLRAVRDGGGLLYVWTVDDARLIAKLTELGVDGIITNDPRLFGPA